jgi:DNA-binding CsgD family transcriptional regulator
LQLDMCEIDLLLQRGQPAEALVITERALPTVFHPGETEALLLAARATTALRQLAVAARLAGDGHAGDAYAARAAQFVEFAGEQAARRATCPPAVALWLAWARAEMLRAQGGSGAAAWADVVSAWADVASLAEQAGRLLEIAAASLRRAEAALDAGDRGEATIAALRRATDVAARLGARPLLDEVDAVVRRSRLEAQVGLAAASGTSRAGRAASRNGHPRDSAAALTQREVEVLALLGQGLSNRQIGKALFISEKTASVHVSNIIGKLGAGSRTEAVVVARRSGVLAR